MSADAQPRKRKDKRKKKDERSEGIGGNDRGPPIPPPPLSTSHHATPSPTSSPDEVMHIYKESKIGGNPCTKILFFIIMSALAGVISIIIMQHRGSTDAIIKVNGSPSGAESGWSIDLGIPEWISPFSFGSDGDDHGEAHEEQIEHEEEEHDHDEEHAEGEDENHDTEHADDGGDTGFFSWLGWSGGSDTDHGVEESHDAHEDNEPEAEPESSGSWFGWGGRDESAADEKVDEETSSGSWFGWGGETGEGQEEHDKEPESAEDDIDDNQDEAAEQEQEDDANEEIMKPIRHYKYRAEEVDDTPEYEENTDSRENSDNEDNDDDNEENEQDDTDLSDEVNENQIKNKITEQEDDDDDIEEDDDDDIEEDDDDELATFLRSLDIEPPSRRNIYREERGPFSEDDLEEQRDDEPSNLEDEIVSSRVDVPDRYFSKNDQDDVDDDDDVQEEFSGGDKEVEKDEENSNKRKYLGKPALVEEDDDDELFPEAAEALRLEQKEQFVESRTQQKEDIREVEDEKPSEVEEEAPFSRDDEHDEDEAQGAKEGKEKVEDTRDIPVIVKQEVKSPAPAVKLAEPVKEKEVEAKPVEVSASAKASEFLAERAAERAARDEVSKQSPSPSLPVKQPPINFLSPPSLTPEQSEGEDEEELSELEQLQYSEGEDIVDEEELVEEEEKLEEEEDIEDLEGLLLGDSPPASDGSEPEVEEDEELEEEESEDEAPQEPIKISSNPASASRDQVKDSRKTGGPQSYEHEDITDDYDWAIREELDMADEEFNRNPSGCLQMYQALLAKHDLSPRARVGIARCYDYLSKESKSNKLLEFAINAYKRALKLNMKDKLFLDAAETLLKLLRFRGFFDQTFEVHHRLISRFGDEPKHRNDLAISYLMLNKLNEAEKLLKETTTLWPKNAVALAHYGLALKFLGKYEESVPPLLLGLELDEAATKDSRFYFHLGDALVRIGRPEKADEIHEKGVKLGLFLSKDQRSLYNVNRLTGKPWWTHDETTYAPFFKKMESLWKKIREEGLRAIAYKKGFLDEAESLRHTGDWKQFELYSRGKRNNANCQITPVTCSLIEEMEAARGCRRGQAKFSLMEGGTHVWSHCGPTNCRLRAHLGLVVPPGPKIRVTNVTRPWEEGKVIIFDDSFEHEVWHDGDEPRLVLIVDLWHPEITETERRTLSPI